MRTQNQTRKLECPFPLCITSELRTKHIDERLLNEVRQSKERRQTNLRKEDKLNDKLQSEMKAEYEKQKREIRKQLNEQFPDKFVDEEAPEKPKSDPDKPKSDLDKVFNHVHQLPMNDEFLEGYFMLFGKHKDRIVLEIPVDRSKKRISEEKTLKEITTIYIY